MVRVDERLRTTGRRIFAAGDVIGGQFTHLAAYQAGVVVSNALFRTRRRAPTVVPGVVFTDPEIARVGLTEAQASTRGGRARRFDHTGLDRAITAGVTDGFAKLGIGPRGRLLGATLAGPSSGESIAGLAAVIARDGRVRDVLATVHPYPTFSEAASRAAGEYLSARHLTPRNRRSRTWPWRRCGGSGAYRERASRSSPGTACRPNSPSSTATEPRCGCRGCGERSRC